jgi:hypothetical protein
MLDQWFQQFTIPSSNGSAKVVKAPDQQLVAVAA